jgi:hypothetical protein
VSTETEEPTGDYGAIGTRPSQFILFSHLWYALTCNFVLKWDVITRKLE